MTKPRRCAPARASEVRRLGAADFDAYAALVYEVDASHHRSLPDIIRSPKRARVKLSEFAAAVRDPDQRYFGVDQNGVLCGFVQARFYENTGDRTMKPFRFISVDLISVTKAAQRKGVGRALMTAVADWGRRRKARVIQLGVWEFNRGAIAFYERLGFEIAIRYMNCSLKRRARR